MQTPSCPKALEPAPPSAGMALPPDFLAASSLAYLTCHLLSEASSGCTPGPTLAFPIPSPVTLNILKHPI